MSRAMRFLRAWTRCKWSGHDWRWFEFQDSGMEHQFCHRCGVYGLLMFTGKNSTATRRTP